MTKEKESPKKAKKAAAPKKASATKTTAKAKVAKPKNTPTTKKDAPKAKMTLKKAAAKEASHTKKETHHPKKEAHPKKDATKVKAKVTKVGWLDSEKQQLLDVITAMIIRRQAEKEGLRSFYKIAQILDMYNQRYVDVNAKFDAIVEYGKQKKNLDTEIFYTAANNDELANNLYLLLDEIKQLEFKIAKERMLAIYQMQNKS